jgi:hypothetical protein
VSAYLLSAQENAMSAKHVHDTVGKAAASFLTATALQGGDEFQL